MAFRLVAKHRQVFSSILTSSSSVATTNYARGFSTKKHFKELAVKCVEKVLLNRIPHTLCMRESDVDLIGLSLSIPGTEKRIETAEASSVFLDMETNDETEDCGYSSSVHAQLDRKRNVLFVTTHLSKDNYSSARYYTSRINLGKHHTYHYLSSDMKDGGLMVTLHKNPLPEEDHS